MVRIKLRDDEFFEEGGERKYSELVRGAFPLENEGYDAKQMLKQKLTALSDRNLDHDSFEKELHGIFVCSGTLEIKPYLQENRILGHIFCTQGSVYLGDIVE